MGGQGERSIACQHTKKDGQVVEWMYLFHSTTCPYTVPSPSPHVQLLAGGGCCCWGKRGGTHTLYPLKNEPRHVFGYITYGSTFHSYSSTVRPVHRTIPARAAACWWLLLPVSAAACCWSFLSWSKLAAFVTIGSLPTSCPFAYGMFVNFSPRTHRL